MIAGFEMISRRPAMIAGRNYPWERGCQPCSKQMNATGFEPPRRNAETIIKWWSHNGASHEGTWEIGGGHSRIVRVMHLAPPFMRTFQLCIKMLSRLCNVDDSSGVPSEQGKACFG